MSVFLIAVLYLYCWVRRVCSFMCVTYLWWAQYRSEAILCLHPAPQCCVIWIVCKWYGQFKMSRQCMFICVWRLPFQSVVCSFFLLGFWISYSSHCLMWYHFFDLGSFCAVLHIEYLILEYISYAILVFFSSSFLFIVVCYVFRFSTIFVGFFELRFS